MSGEPAEFNPSGNDLIDYALGPAVMPSIPVICFHGFITHSLSDEAASVWLVLPDIFILIEHLYYYYSNSDRLDRSERIIWGFHALLLVINALYVVLKGIGIVGVDVQGNGITPTDSTGNTLMYFAGVFLVISSYISMALLIRRLKKRSAWTPKSYALLGIYYAGWARHIDIYHLMMHRQMLGATV